MNLAPLQPLYDRPGPFLSLYLDRSRTTEDVRPLMQARWRNAREGALEQGADPVDIAAAERVLDQDIHVGGEHGRGIIAGNGDVIVDEVLKFPPSPEIAVWSPLPHLLPLLAGLGPRMPHAVVVVDRIGADITVHLPYGREDEQVEGTDHPIRKVHAGGWSERRYQASVDNTWEQNAKKVAHRVDELVPAYRPRLVAVAGDVRARSLLRRELSDEADALVTEVDAGGRAAGASTEALDERVDALLVERDRDEMRSVIEKFQEEIGQFDRAVQGFEATVGALREGRVDTLILRDDVDADMLWAGPEPLHLAVYEDELAAMRVPRRFRVPASQALLRAAVATSADGVVLDGARLGIGNVGMQDGVGAILRYSVTS